MSTVIEYSIEWLSLEPHTCGPLYLAGGPWTSSLRTIEDDGIHTGSSLPNLHLSWGSVTNNSTGGLIFISSVGAKTRPKCSHSCSQVGFMYSVNCTIKIILYFYFTSQFHLFFYSNKYCRNAGIMLTQALG
jgi:hypothetical protein